MTRRSVALFLLVLLFAGGASAADSYLVIVAGLGGEPRYRDAFHESAVAMREAAIERNGLAEDRVFYLAEDPALAPELIHAKSTKENVAAVFTELQAAVAPGDTVFVLLLGHGSFRSEESRFNLPGRDLSAQDFALLLDPFAEQRVVFVNASSASGGFVPALAAPNRVVVTATKSGFERNESQFGKYFVEAYAGAGADTDKNERISVLEAFVYARARVDGFYDENNILKTEHALLDDLGDGNGVHDLGEGDGEGARGVYLMSDGAAAEGFTEAQVEADPELAELVARKLELEGRVEALRLQKDAMPADVYAQELETLLLELATLSARIEAKRP